MGVFKARPHLSLSVDQAVAPDLPCRRYSIMLMVPPVTGIMVTGGASMMPLIRFKTTELQTDLPTGEARDTH